MVEPQGSKSTPQSKAMRATKKEADLSRRSKRKLTLPEKTADNTLSKKKPRLDGASTQNPIVVEQCRLSDQEWIPKVYSSQTKTF